jgi:hypothetical protein
MSMQETATRYEEAAQAVHESGHRVTHERIAEWLRARDGAGCSCRDTVALVQRYRALTEPRMDAALSAVIAKLDELPGWERDTVLARLRRHYGRSR